MLDVVNENIYPNGNFSLYSCGVNGDVCCNNDPFWSINKYETCDVVRYVALAVIAPQLTVVISVLPLAVVIALWFAIIPQPGVTYIVDPDVVTTPPHFIPVSILDSYQPMLKS